ncbi:hypothetical protein A6A04_16270 [Paramagnetospirillum marisnigri]|uniref:Uncharacterized protein n=1 Tax=Paramagnetospirillum marisnigri TaxID=1285242 RepID=A0A178MT55_9PROT|nr:hypothetical protein [Paramagnetospirillum marisnigri]OAN51331.1 hypothetical protein A6A04_16270 [Paramagnetospirillum marisnigri]
MSTALKLHASSLSPSATQNRIQALIAAAPIRATDRVAIIGQGSFDLLLGLAGKGGMSAVALRSPSRCRTEAGAADVIWFTGLETIGSEIAAAIDYLESPRIVVIELTRDNARSGLASILGQLRAKGLADQAISNAGGRALVVASRPAWLRRVI